ncbi:MAG: exosortase/archaeosortase family protein [Sedimentisphaerales bacterium]
MINKLIRRGHASQISSRHQMQDMRLVSVLLAMLAVTMLSYWSISVRIFKEWQRSDDYSAGQLVPLIALFLVWRQRKTLRKCMLRPCWWGIALLILAQAARFYGLLFMYESGVRYSMVLTLAGLVLMVAGRQVFRSVSWILVFLFLMFPLPGRVHNLINGPLQNMATTGSVFLLEAFGVRVSQQGNVVMLNEKVPMAVAEACSGLRMLTAFVIVAAFMAYMVKRSPRQKAVLLLSSIPVAVMCNILRLCVTAVLFLLASSEMAEKFFHDFAGLAMMPAAVLLMFGELWLMDKLKVPEPTPQQAQARARTKPATSAGETRTKKRKQYA